MSLVILLQRMRVWQISAGHRQHSVTWCWNRRWWYPDGRNQKQTETYTLVTESWSSYCDVVLLLLLLLCSWMFCLVVRKHFLCAVESFYITDGCKKSVYVRAYVRACVCVFSNIYTKQYQTNQCHSWKAYCRLSLTIPRLASMSLS